jgi:hypothetical protein
MTSLTPLVLLVFVAVCTIAPFLFMMPSDYEDTANRFSVQKMEVQLVSYTFARLCSFIFIPTMQLSMLQKHGFPGAAILISLAEAAGFGLQLWIVRCVQRIGVQQHNANPSLDDGYGSGMNLCTTCSQGSLSSGTTAMHFPQPAEPQLCASADFRYLHACRCVEALTGWCGALWITLPVHEARATGLPLCQLAPPLTGRGELVQTLNATKLIGVCFETPVLTYKRIQLHQSNVCCMQCRSRAPHWAPQERHLQDHCFCNQRNAVHLCCAAARQRTAAVHSIHSSIWCAPFGAL